MKKVIDQGNFYKYALLVNFINFETLKSFALHTLFFLTLGFFGRMRMSLVKNRLQDS